MPTKFERPANDGVTLSRAAHTLGELAGLVGLGALAVMLSAVGCRRGEPVDIRVGPAGADAPQGDGGRHRSVTASSAAGTSREARDAAAIAAGAVAPPKHAVGAWIDSNSFRLRVDRLQGCGPSTPATGAGVVGVAVKIQSRSNELSISPRDFTLESGGVILQPRLPGAPPADGCPRPLPVKRLKVRQTAEGLVVFDVPPSFRPASGDVTLAYRPTRWGGGDRVEVTVPGCLETCPAAAPPARAPVATTRRQERL